MICTRLRLGHLSVCVGDSLRRSEAIVKYLELCLWMRSLLLSPWCFHDSLPLSAISHLIGWNNYQHKWMNEWKEWTTESSISFHLAIVWLTNQLFAWSMWHLSLSFHFIFYLIYHSVHFLFFSIILCIYHSIQNRMQQTVLINSMLDDPYLSTCEHSHQLRKRPEWFQWHSN